MKGNKMSAILAILLMLSGALFVPRAFAQDPADSIQSNPLAINWTYPTHTPGETFTVYVDVTGVGNLLSFQCGFYFNPTVLQVVSVSEGGFLSNNGADPILTFPGTIDNVNGEVIPFGYGLLGVDKAKTGSGHLIEVVMQINPALWPPDTSGPVLMIDLTVTDMDLCETILMDKENYDVSPPPDQVYDGTFSLSAAPAPPVAYFVTSAPPFYVDSPISFDASGSTRGWNGYDWVPIVDYAWDWGDGSPVEHTAIPTTTHTYSWTPPPDVQSFTVTLIVTDEDGRVSDPFSRTLQVQVRPSGAVIDLQSQRWRYQDPFLVPDPYFGEGLGYDCDLFRPGEWVELWAYVTYGGDPVQAQLISYEVHDNNDNIVLTGTAVSDENGWAYYYFRVPWPCDPPGPESLFGTWKAIATWEIGTHGPGIPGYDKPYAETINDTMSFKVGWGIWIVSKEECDELGNPKGDFFKSEIVYVKLGVQNDYMMARQVTLTVTLYDDLMVPINTPAMWVGTLDPGFQYITMPGIHIEKWAFVGTGTAKANAFTTLPFFNGISWCPEVTNTFIIKKSGLPPWYPDP
ncbi:MAG: PKD domain-containing protein [Candidatus Bathyarchaeia archaeon]|jgi:hypothetical protein|nr:PKD domain-containing protein [Candidatus Bathyarchaeota archaeon A05DMB-4]MDH7595557.1 PKD domain-containing protein [Candidatus Bathyarchaeota archaeon]